MPDNTNESLPVPSSLIGTQLERLTEALPAASQYPKPSLSQAEAQAVDLNVHNFTVAALCSLWKSVRSVDEACKLALTTTKALRERRESLCLKHAADSARHGAAIVYPLD